MGCLTPIAPYGKLALALLLLTQSAHAYTYYYTETTPDPSKWTTNGDPTTATGGSKISNLAIPDGSNIYEIKTVLNIKSSGGTYTSPISAPQTTPSTPPP